MDAITATARAIAGSGPKRFGRFARSVLRRYAQHQIHQWLDNLWEHNDEDVPDEDVGRDLTEHANKLPEMDLHLGDDGEIHHYSG